MKLLTHAVALIGGLGGLSVVAQTAPVFPAPDVAATLTRVEPHFHEPAGSPVLGLVRDKPPYQGKGFAVGKPERVMPTGAGQLSAMVAYGDRVELALSTTEYFNAISDNGSDIPSGNHFNPLLSPGRISIDLGHAAAGELRKFDQWIDFRRGSVIIELETRDGKARVEIGGDMEQNNLVVSVHDERSTRETATVRYENWRPSVAVRASEGNLIATEAVDTAGATGSKAQSMSLALEIGCVSGESFSASAIGSSGAITIPARTARDFTVVIAAKCAHGAPPVAAAQASWRKTAQIPAAEFTQQKENWWGRFWAPAWLDLAGPDADYLMRLWYTTLYSYACVGEGPILPKFNGGPGLVFQDTRSWGDGYWWQNQREISFWPMAGAGHPEFTRKSILFFDETAERSRDSARRFALPGRLLGEGSKPGDWSVPFGETPLTEPAGEPFTGDRSDPPAALARREATKPGYNALNFLGGLEFVQAVFDYVQYTGDTEVEKKIGAPWLKGETVMSLGLLAEGPDHRYHLRCADAAEQWWKVDDPAPMLAGIQFLLTMTARHGRELGFEPALVAAAQQRLDRLCPLPTVESWNYKTDKPGNFWNCPSENVVPGEALLAPFAMTDGVMGHNSENPELYAVYPFGFFDLNSDAAGLALARRTFEHRFFKNTAGWSQCSVQSARLGLPGTLDVILDHAKKHQRWPYGGWSSPGGMLYANSPVTDCPFLDGAGVNLTALQESLLQSHSRVTDAELLEAGTIRLLPAVSQNWSGQFQLRARGGFIVTVRFAKGKVEAARFEATQNTKLRLENPFGVAVIGRIAGQQTLPVSTSEKIITLDTRRGDIITVTAAPSPKQTAAR